MVYYRQQKGNTKYKETAKENPKVQNGKAKTEGPHKNKERISQCTKIAGGQ